jgi:mRNA interferase MazF
MPQPGEVWIADIPFTSGAASKLRPVLVLWTDAADDVVTAVTSAQPRSATDVTLQDWSAAGLHSKAVPARLFRTRPCGGVWVSLLKAMPNS